MSNKEICINDTDTNLGSISADKSDLINECQRQLYDIITYNKIVLEEAKNLIEKIKIDEFVKSRKGLMIVIPAKAGIQ